MVEVDLIDRNTGSIVKGEFEYDTEQRFALTLRMPGGQVISANERDYFESLCAIRRKLEPRGVTPLCNGARRDVYSFGGSRQMGGGLGAHILKMNVPADNAVYLFDPAPRELVTTVAEQRKYFEDWCESVIGRRPSD